MYPKVFHGNGQRVQHFGVDLIFLQVNEIHLFANLLERSFRTQSGDIGTDVTVRFGGDLFQFHVVVQLHVLRVNAQNLQTTYQIQLNQFIINEIKLMNNY